MPNVRVGSPRRRDLEAPAIERYPTRRPMWRAYELRQNVTASDVAYIALAEALDRPLVTADARLDKAPGIPVRG